MENKLIEILSNLKANSKKAFTAYIMAGERGIKGTIEDAVRLREMGTNILELGVPFSDPAADGLTIQEAGKRALSNGTTIYDVLNCVEEIKKRVDMPIVIMTYLNPILSVGIEKFFTLSREKGVDGVIIPDVPLEEANPYIDSCIKNNVSYIPLVTLTSSTERIKKIVNIASGFVYCVNTLSVTGKENKISNDTLNLLKQVKSFSNVAVLSGFGISTKEEARELANASDGVIVGSQIIKHLQNKEYKKIKNIIENIDIVNNGM
ncbi:MAG: tryptophan synthase subunit alpha [Clostridium sp.]